jgi:hypothetical protein
MAIPIVKGKETKKVSKVIKSGDDDYDVLRKLACDLLIACQNASAAYDFFRRATQGDEYVKIQSNSSTASIFFSKNENADYISRRRLEIAKAGFDEYCKIKNIEHAGFKEIEEKSYEGLSERTPAEVRDETLKVLQRVIDTTTDEVILLSATKQRTELTDAKFKDKGIDLSAAEKLIHFYLPAPYCDDCPNRVKIEKDYEHLPNINLELDEEQHDEE